MHHTTQNETGSYPTLRITRPLGKTLRLAIVVIGLFLAASEGLARIQWVADKLPPPSIGSTHLQFEIKLNRLDRYKARYGSVDCIILGSSQVYQGFSPEVFTHAYQQVSGKDLRCFNFGLSEVTGSEAGPIAQILVKRYHPALLIYGTSIRDFSEHTGADANLALVQIPWTHYELGQFAPLGWLVAHSRAYQDYLMISSWFHVADWKRRVRLDSRITESGYTNQSSPPGQTLEKLPNRFGRWYGNCPKTSADVAGLEQVLSLAREDVEVVLLENPLPRVYMAAFDRNGTLEEGKANYIKCFVNWLDGYAHTYGTVLIRTNGYAAIPENEWVDYNHLTRNGATIYSTWLGNWFGDAVKQGLIPEPVQGER